MPSRMKQPIPALLEERIDPYQKPVLYLESLRNNLEREIEGSSKQDISYTRQQLEELRREAGEAYSIASRMGSWELGKLYPSQQEAAYLHRKQQKLSFMGSDGASYIAHFNLELKEHGELYSAAELAEIRRELKRAYGMAKWSAAQDAFPEDETNEPSHKSRDAQKQLLSQYRSSLLKIRHLRKQAKVLEGNDLESIIISEEFSGTMRLKYARQWMKLHSSVLYSDQGTAMLEKIENALHLYEMAAKWDQTIPHKPMLHKREQEQYRLLWQEFCQAKEVVERPRKQLDATHAAIEEMLGTLSRKVPPPIPAMASGTITKSTVAADQKAEHVVDLGELLSMPKVPPRQPPPIPADAVARVPPPLPEGAYNRVPPPLPTISAPLATKGEEHRRGENPNDLVQELLAMGRKKSEELGLRTTTAPIRTMAEEPPQETAVAEEGQYALPNAPAPRRKRGLLTRIGTAAAGAALTAGIIFGIASFPYTVRISVEEKNSAAVESLEGHPPRPVRPAEPLVQQPAPAPSQAAVQPAPQTPVPLPPAAPPDDLTPAEQKVWQLVNNGYRTADGRVQKGADEYKWSRYGTPQDGVFTNQEVLNRVLQMGDSVEDAWSSANNCFGIMPQRLIDLGRAGRFTRQTISDIVDDSLVNRARGEDCPVPW